MENTKKLDVKRLVKIIIPVIIAIIIAMINPPGELTVESMRFAGIFICMILWMVFEVFPDFVITLTGLGIMVALKVCSFSSAFSPFAGSSVWLVIGAFGLSAGVGKSGLLKRLSYMILKLFPESFQGQVLALGTAGLVISPLIPSLNAKAAILAPFSAQVSESMGYEKGSKGAKGLFAVVAIMTTVAGMCFFSGAVPVATLIGMMPEGNAAEMSWMSWFKGTWLYLIVLLVLCFLVIMILYKPKTEKGEKTVEKGLAKKELEALGPMTRNEKITAVLLVVALLGWMLTKVTGIDATTVSLLVLMVMFLTGVMDGPDFKNRIAWSSVIFIGTVYTLASLLSSFGWSSYLAQVLSPVLSPIASNVWLLIPVICVVTYLLRTVVVSQTAAITIIWAIFGGIGIEYGIHPFVILFTGYMSTLVWHYAGNNVTYATCLAATNDKMVSFQDTFQMNVVYMVVNLVCCMVSIPLWKMIGYC